MRQADTLFSKRYLSFLLIARIEKTIPTLRWHVMN